MPVRRNIDLKSDERIDELQRNGYGIIQSKDGFCFGMDAVLLSGFARVREGETAVDLGSGNGIIPILLSAKTKGKRFVGVEIQKKLSDMAIRSVWLNGLEDKIEIICGDLREIISPHMREIIHKDMRGIRGDTKEIIRGDTKETELQELIGSRGQIDVVTSNPPYIRSGHGLKNPDDCLAAARHEVFCTLDDVCKVAGYLLSPHGRFYMVHRPTRLTEIIQTLSKYRLEPKRIKPVYPFIDRESNMILIEAIKDAGCECHLEKPLIIYQEPGKYSDEIYEIYGY